MKITSTCTSRRDNETVLFWRYQETLFQQPVHWISDDRKAFEECVKNTSYWSAVREDGLKRQFAAEREILKLTFAFDHIKYARYNTYQHIYLSNWEKIKVLWKI